MPGQIKHMIDSILEQRAKGSSTLLLTTRAKLTLKGINPDRFTAASPDDEGVIAKVRAAAAELGVRI